MAFDVAYFSTAGLNLLASLTSSKSLRIKNIYVDEAEHQAADLNQLPTWWANETSTTMGKLDAVLAAAGHVGDEARLITKLTLKPAQTATVTAKTIVITACGVESGVETSEITLCGVSDDNGVEVLYNASSIKLSTSVAIYFEFSNAASITFADAIDPDYVVHSEIDRLVSCHAIGDPTSGIAQDINGTKTFKDGAVIDINASKLSFKYGNSEQGWIGDTGVCGLQFTSTNVLQTPTACFKFCNDATEIMRMAVDQDGLHYTTSIPDKLNANTIISSDISTSTLSCSTSCSINGITLTRTYNGVSIAGDLMPTTNSDRYLGLPDKRWDTIYCDTYDVYGGITIKSDYALNHNLVIHEDEGDIWLNGFLNGHGLILGRQYNTSTQTYGDKAFIQCGDISAKNITASGNAAISGNATITGNVTASGIFNGNLNGVIPTPSSATEIPVGCICILKASVETRRGDQYSKMPNETGWMNRRTSSSCTLTFGDLEPTSSDTSLVYDDYTQSSRFMALSHADADKSFIAIRTV